MLYVKNNMAVIYLFQASLFIYVCYLAGEFIRVKMHITQEEIIIKKTVYSIGLGYGFIGTAGLIFALFGLYKPVFFYMLGIFIIVLEHNTLYEHFSWIRLYLRKISNIFTFLNQKYKRYTFLKVIITLWVILYILISLMPSAIDYNDGLYYHIPFAMELVQSESISFPVRDSITYGYLPLFAETLYGIPMTLFHNFVSFKVIQLSAYFLLLLLLIDFMKKHIHNEQLIIIMIVLLLSNMPLVYNALNGGMIDIFTFFFGFAAVLALIELLIPNTKPNYIESSLSVSGIFLGLALATKYLALFFGVLCAILITWFFFKHKESIKDVVRKCIIYILPVILLGGFWYIKNILLMGNPFFPFFSTQDNTIGLQQDVGRFVLDRTFLNFFIFPFLLFGKKLLFLPYPFMTAVSFIILYIMMVFFLFKKKITSVMLILFVCMELYLLMLFFFSHQIRFVIPALILATLLIIIEFDAFFTKIIPNSFTFNRLFSWCVKICALLFFVITINSSTLKNNIQCLIGIQSVNQCLTEKITPYINAPNSNLQFYNTQ